MFLFVSFKYLAIFTVKWQLVKTIQLAGNDHVIDILTNEDMENILLYIFQYFTLYYTCIINMFIYKTIDLFHNDFKRRFQDDTRNLIGSAIMKVLFKPIKFRLTSRFPRLTSLWKRSIVIGFLKQKWSVFMIRSFERFL